jgi:glycosyltransferase involved in cell wall biosynthesis
MILPFLMLQNGKKYFHDLRKKMQLLYLTNKPVYPTVDGGCKAMQAMLELLLATEIPITHFTLSTEKHPYKSTEYPKDVREKCTIKAFEVATKPTFFGLIKSFFIGNSYNIARFYVPEFEIAISNFAPNEEVIVVMESIYLAPYLPELKRRKNTRIFIRTHNVEHDLWLQKSNSTKNPFKKIAYTYIANRLKTEEIIAFSEADELFTLTENDANSINDLGVTTPCSVVPMHFQMNHQQVDYSINDLFFVGSMNWQPNIKAVSTLKEEIFPNLKVQFPFLTLKLAGSFSKKEALANGIEHLGFVSDLGLFLQTSGILVAPISSGSGVRVKLLEAMSHGVPIVTTEIGAMGIPENKGLIIATSLEDFTAQIQRLIASEELRQTTGQLAKAFVQKHYSLTTVLTKIIERFK